MAAVGQEHGIAGYIFGPHHVRGNSAGGRYSLDYSISVAGLRKEDYVLAVPRSSAALEHVTKRLRRAAAGGDLLELALREKSDVAAVGRPEGVRGVVGGRHRVSLKRVQRPQPELALSIHLRRDCEETTVRGNSEAVNVGRVFRQRDAVALRPLDCRLLAEVNKGHDQRGSNAHCSQYYPREFRT